MSVGTLRLGCLLILVVLYGLYAVEREHRYLEARVFYSFGGFVVRVRSGA